MFRASLAISTYSTVEIIPVDSITLHIDPEVEYTRSPTWYRVTLSASFSMKPSRMIPGTCAGGVFHGNFGIHERPTLGLKMSIWSDGISYVLAIIHPDSIFQKLGHLGRRWVRIEEAKDRALDMCRQGRALESSCWSAPKLPYKCHQVCRVKDNPPISLSLLTFQHRVYTLISSD
jgi:hypothetical protein